MRLPQPASSQSRLLEFSFTTFLVAVLWICSQPTHFAYAAEIPVPPEAVQRSQFEASIPPAPPDDPPLEILNELEEAENGDAFYAPEFAYFDRSLVGRQEDDLNELNDNQMVGMDIAPNTTRHFRFKKSQLRRRLLLEEIEVTRESENSNGTLRQAEEENAPGVGIQKRQAQTQLRISANTCKQPTPTVLLVTDPPPQLKLWVWTQAAGSKTSSSRSRDAKNVTFESGHVNYTLATDQDVFITVDAPSLTQGWNGSWHFEIAATANDVYYHSYNDTTNFIFMVDTDSDSTLFITHDLTDFNDTAKVAEWKKKNEGLNMPFNIYAFPDDKWSPLMGLERSYCGLKDQFQDNKMFVNTSITTMFGQGLPRGQFHVQGLETSTNYTGFLILNGNTNITGNDTTVGAGGQVFKAFNWQTKADDTCQVIFGLEECSSVAYAVPSSTEWKNNDTGLMAFYDGMARTYMANFNRSLAQVACDTASTAQYSLARNCTDCTNDYRSWLCSVLIPRCEDWTATDPWLHPRNINTPFPNGTLPDTDNMSMTFNDTVRGRYAYNQSRNNEIDKVIKPGPYKELLPCEDLCFDIVRSCPAQLGFACPNPPMRELSYGQRDPRGKDLRCNFPGAVVDLTVDTSAAGTLRGKTGAVVAMAVFLASFWI